MAARGKEKPLNDEGRVSIINMLILIECLNNVLILLSNLDFSK